MATPGAAARKSARAPADPAPSASVLLVSPTNEVLLLHRVRTSSAFASAHVFPGGNVAPEHDGAVAAPGEAGRHEDSEVYRLAAIRETFEESGILLARNNGFGRLLELPEREREQGRKLVHTGEVRFLKWLAGKGGRADVEGLIPFTRWVTPTNVPKRFTTQMYLYFLPLGTSVGAMGSDGAANIPVPKDDGGIEHTAARFLPPAQWLAMARAGEIILFPPQMFLLHLIAPFLSPPGQPQPSAPEELRKQRQGLREFVKTGDPPWGEKCISPTQVALLEGGKRAVLGLDKPGPELKGSDRRGEFDRVVLVNFKKEGPRDVEIRWRKDVMELQRKEKL